MFTYVDIKRVCLIYVLCVCLIRKGNIYRVKAFNRDFK